MLSPIYRQKPPFLTGDPKAVIRDANGDGSKVRKADIQVLTNG